MKPLKEVARDKEKSYQDVSINAVHRSSLLVPKIESNETWISFLNHFLIKRGIESVALKVSAYDDLGITINSKTFEITEKKVYAYHLENIFPRSNPQSFQIEFFSSKNLFIPFPAVMINHISPFNWNIVHSYNRILNDLMEEEKISSITVDEAAIDLINTSNQKTFVLFHTGQRKLEMDSKIEFVLKKNEPNSRPLNAYFDLTNMNKMSVKMFLINDVFKSLPIIDEPEKYTLKVKAPKQVMFYGRMLVGRLDPKTKTISGNHSYYDSSKTEEYFEEPRSYGTFPYFEGYRNSIRFYPIISPSKGELNIYATISSDGNLTTKKIFSSDYSPHSSSLSLEINNLILKNNLTNVKSFSVEYLSKDSLGSPTRINHQLIYCPKKSRSLNTSINVSLLNNAVTQLRSYTWIQLINNENISSILGITFFNLDKNTTQINPDSIHQHSIDMDIYDENGLYKSTIFKLSDMDSLVFSSSELCPSQFVWVVAKSNHPNLRLFTFHSNENSGYSSGEHGF